ncbi:LytR C-terminal domain-containing protein [Pseudoduganella sp.]|uniref:LytR C-terminal domain-containing protein n=1 Tax=Pseudoduganella sp. TaxID=1880898 RepID=UPI0035B06A17
MIKLKPIALAVVGCGLLQGCNAPNAQRPLAVSPVVRGDLPGNQAASWNRLARFHHERGQLALALGAYAQSLALDVHQLEARNAVAVIEAQQGNLESARRALVALVNDYPAEAQPHTNLGYVQHLMGDHAGAAQTLRRAMALGAGPKAFQNLQLAEASLRGSPLPAADQPQLAAAPAPAQPPAPAPAPTAVPSAEPSAEPSATAPAIAAAALPARAPSVIAPAPMPAPAKAAAPNVMAAAPAAALAPAAQTAAPAAVAPAMATAAPAADARTIAAPLTVLPTSAREIGSHMELVKVASNIYELKTRVASDPVPAPAAKVPPSPALAAAAPKPAEQAVPQATKLAMARLEVANGNGVTGMARRFRHLLGAMGIPVDRLSNDKPYKQVSTTIQYSPGFEKQAASLQKALQGKAQLASRQLTGSDVRLVLGKDASQSLAAATEAAGLSLVAVHDDDSN